MKNNKEVVYWLSFTDLGTNTQITPAVKNGILGVGKKEEKKIQLFTSITDGLGVLSIGRGGMSGKVVSVYKPTIPDPNILLTPSLSDIPYRDIMEGKEYWCLIPLSVTKVCDIKIGKEIDEKSFKYGGRVLKFTATLTMKFKIYAWDEILPEWDKKGKTMKLKRKNFGKTAEKVTKNNSAAREAGLIGGSALIGLSGGLVTKEVANNLNKARKEVVREAEKQIKEEAKRKLKRITDPTDAISKDIINGEKLGKLEELKKISTKLKKVTKPVSKFAKTKGGKAALIGVPTAVIGGVVYKSAKKKSDKKEGKGE